MIYFTCMKWWLPGDWPWPNNPTKKSAFSSQFRRKFLLPWGRCKIQLSDCFGGLFSSHWLPVKEFVCALCSNLFIGEAIIVLLEQKYLISRVRSGSGLSSLLDLGGHCVDLPLWVHVHLPPVHEWAEDLPGDWCGAIVGVFKTASLCLTATPGQVPPPPYQAEITS